MSVVIETTLGDITVDLYLDQRPVTCLNFLKLCKMKYYNFNLFHSIRSGFIAQTGDPTGEGSEGQSIFGVLEGPEKRFFSGEKMPKIRHTDAGLISMVCTGDMMVGSQFFFTLAPDLDSLDGVHCVIGEVSEGHDVLRQLNDVICDESHRPYRDVRITHTVVLEDPFNDPPGLRAPSRSPSPSAERLKDGRIAPDEEIDETQGKSANEIQEIIEEKEAKARATILEIIGDLPDAEIAPPENVLFVCKLNPVTTDDDLEIIFSRFGKIVTCEVIRDKKTGDSLQYAFIEFADKKSCEDAYFKMDNVLIDDRRIHVDFSQSVSKIKWLGKGRGVKHINDDDENDRHANNITSKRSRSRDRDHKNGRDHHSRRDHSYRQRPENSNRISDRERQFDRHQRSDKYIDRQHKDKYIDRQHKDKTRSESKEDKIKEEWNNDRNNAHDSSRFPEKDNSSNKHNSHRHGSNKDQDSRYTNKHSQVKSESSSRNHREQYEHTHRKYNKESYSDNERKTDLRNSRSDKDVENNQLKRKNDKALESHKENKYSKSDHKYSVPRTPSPVVEKERKKLKLDKQSAKSKELKTNRNNKNKRKTSTSSSDSDSSESSSSSESTSSSEEDRKKSLKKRKKKYSSSSSSSSSESSSSSSDSSSSSSSSDSEPKKRKRLKKSTSKKVVKKSKKKL